MSGQQAGGVTVSFEDVLSEVHTAYQAMTSVLVNELAEARAVSKKLAAELEAAQQALRVQENRKPGLPPHLAEAGRSEPRRIKDNPQA